MERRRSHVLVVEDDPAIRMLLSRLVERQGHTCHAVADGEQALQATAQQAPDLILLDLMMPGMNGFQFLRAYRARGATHTPVIVVTAKHDALDQFWARKLGVRQFIQKPFAPDAVALGIELALIDSGGGVTDTSAPPL